MANWIRKGERITQVEFSRDFDWEGEVRSGFSFPCDETGEVTLLNPAAIENFEKCVANTHERPVVNRGIRRRESSYWQPGIIKCEGSLAVCKCGIVHKGAAWNECIGWHDFEETSYVPCPAQVYLEMGGTNTCEVCEADYNGFGQRLAPREQWGWDTGETVGEILAADRPIGTHYDEDGYPDD